MMRLRQILIGMIVIGICASPLYAEDSREPNMEIKLGVERLQGTTLLSIGGQYQHSTEITSYPAPDGSPDGRSFHFPYSELEMPMDVYMGAIAVGLNIGKRWKLTAGAKVNFTTDSDASEESYYGIPYDDDPTGGVHMVIDPQSLDIFSEMETELDAMIVDINLRYAVFDYSYEDDFGKGRWAAFVGIGYRYQDYGFKLSDLSQTSPSGETYTLREEAGEVVTYDISYHIPYVEVGISETVGKISVEASFGFAPYIITSDEETRGYEQDVDLDGEMVSEGDSDGMAYLASLDARYDFTKRWFLGVRIDFLQVNATGDQEKTLNGVKLDDIKEEIETTQVLYGITAGFAF